MSARAARGAWLVVAWAAAACSDAGPTIPQPASVAVTPPAAVLRAIGDTVRFSARALDARGSDVAGVTFAWTVDDATVARVDGQGLVTALARGAATVRAAVGGGAISGTAPVAVDQAAAELRVASVPDSLIVGETSSLAATVLDPNGHAVPGVVVTWSSTVESVATVSATGVVTAHGNGSTVIRATAAGLSAEAPLVVHRASLLLARDTALAGTVRVRTLHVPAGVTVSATGALTVEARERVDLLGSVVADCHAITIEAGGPVRLAGRIANACSDTLATTAGGVRVVGGDSLIFEGEIASSGHVYLTNDATLTDADFPPMPPIDDDPDAAQSLVRSRVGLGTAAAALRTDATACETIRGRVEIADGGPGAAGGDYVQRCRGDLVLDAADVDAGNGGRGIQADVSSNVFAEAHGGPGGTGGSVRIEATGDIIVRGDGTLAAGDGGTGGGGFARGTRPGGTPERAAGAEATGGRGGAGGAVRLYARGAIRAAAGGTLDIHDGAGGAGGRAIATGADGDDATAAAKAQAGGHATARGGQGGSSLARVRRGGRADAAAGNGGNGSAAFPDGADGGSGHGVGGDAGRYRPGGVPNMTTDDGGDVHFFGGSGGNGFGGCAPPVAAGGRGGNGGAIRGNPGASTLSGRDARSNFDQAGNGGKGGDGTAPGAGGLAGADHTTGIRDISEPVLRPGAPGSPCAGPLGDVRVGLRFQEAEGPIPPADYQQPLLAGEGGAQVGSIRVSTRGNSAQHTIPDRLRTFQASPIDLGTGAVELPGVAGARVERVRFCLSDAVAPIIVEQIDREHALIDQKFLPPPAGGAGCLEVTLHDATDFVRIITLSGVFILAIVLLLAAG